LPIANQRNDRNTQKNLKIKVFWDNLNIFIRPQPQYSHFGKGRVFSTALKVVGRTAILLTVRLTCTKSKWCLNELSECTTYLSNWRFFGLEDQHIGVDVYALLLCKIYEQLFSDSLYNVYLELIQLMQFTVELCLSYMWNIHCVSKKPAPTNFVLCVC